MQIDSVIWEEFYHIHIYIHGIALSIRVTLNTKPASQVLIKSVQRSFTKRLPGLSNLPYTKRLEFLGIDSLELRRLRYDLVFVYKMLFGLVDLKFSDYFTLRANSTAHGHDYKLFQTYSRLNVCKHFFCE